MDFYLFLGTLAATIFTLLCSILYMVYGKIRVQENKIIASPPIMASSSSSLSLSLPSSSRSRNWEHDVFPSFHGPDVRKHFLSHIKKEFERKGITPFIDNNIERGESIGPELKRAIQESKIAIVLLSKNYASSSWCLDELVEIMSKVEGQKVLTIFYEVDPTDVKKQTGDFGKVFKKTCRGKTKKKIETWRKALEGVATIAGYHSRNWGDEAVMIQNIAVDISKMLNNLAPSPDLDRLIGMEGHMERMKPFLRLDSDEVRMIGIWGPPGIGKSTIARFLFNQLSNSFRLKAIMVNIKGNYPRPCLDEGDAQLQLQSKMLSQMINHKDIMITHLGVAQERLKDKEVLLILDDVDRSAQLDALAKNVGWFGPRSRIIITTENLKLLKAHGINHIYKVHFPSDDEALEMFCMYAFGLKSPKAGFMKLSHQVTFLAGNLPLGLKVMGSYFRGMSKYEWERVLPNLWSHLDGEIDTVLKFSYDTLCDGDKSIFLHIACFFNNEEIKKVEAHLANKFLNVRQRLDVLAQKSLISFDQDIIEMHSLLVQLGKEIVRKSYPEPRQRQFLVDDKDICQVLTDPTPITTSVVGICSTDTLTWFNLNVNERTFEEMSNLQFLRFKRDSEYPNMASLPGCLKHISPKLQLLDWKYSPMTCLPFTS
ncbi:hypothetical protein AALP_AA5G017400 [Arabis alpina]|uniref:ADP-ribosyl cyclase/cyclic ADP-ribose hydrolase n=1 Tax=Arabis alpina TaxID=50452 RepID=A0A087GUB8_ARAAL|nr:hypothetical protein AALP_AA5G017400 [Arabis alpina]